MITPSAFQRLHWRKPSRLDLPPFGPKAAHLWAALETVGVPLVPQETSEDLTPRDELVHLLQAAAEIEHTLMLEYLYAGFSLADDAPAAWRDALMRTAREEMGHLLAVQNLLLAVGGQPYLARLTPENTPDHPFLFRLEALGRGSIGKYVAAEAPPRSAIPPADLADFQAALDAARQAGMPVNDAGEAAHPVGVLYARIYHLLMRSDLAEGPWDTMTDVRFPSRHIPDSAFDHPQLAFQAVARDVDPGGWPGVSSGPAAGGGGIFVRRVANRADALNLVHLIAEQGEGTVAKPGEDSHFGRFLALFRAVVQTPLPLPVRPLPADPTIATAATVDPLRQITDPVARGLCALLDVRYRMLLAEIALTLRLSDIADSGPLRAKLAAHAVRAEMRDGIAGVVDEILRRPRTAAGDPLTDPCGPTFSEGSPDPTLTAAELARTLLGDMRDSAARIQALSRPLAEGGLGLDLPVFDDLAEDDERLADIVTPILQFP